MERKTQAIFMLGILLFSLIIIPNNTSADETQENDAWDPYWQPWSQYGRDPGHSRTMPEHGQSGLMTIENPAVNWVAFDSGLGADGYGVAIANMSNSISSSEGAKERCGEGKLFAVLTHTDPGTSDRHLAIIEGDTAKVAWDVNLGDARYIRSTPVLVDVDGDGKTEIAIAYDTDSALKVDLWAPELVCSESGWVESGHSNERLWSWTDSDLRIGITSPHWPTRQSNHFSVTQPLLADLSLDGSPELVISAVDTSTDDPTVIAVPLGLQTPELDWQVSLDRGTHPSDPAFASLDDNSGSIVLTTIDSGSGNMWIWQIDGETGSLDWERVSIPNTDSDSDTPRLRLPGPVITQLDGDAPPEMILTLPVDDNQETDGMGAQYVGMELTSTNELWRFRAKNGYGDSEPLPVDTDGDGITDRVCWATWSSDGWTDRQGFTGCHDITIDPPFREWSRNLQRGSGVENDEIAVSAPISLDLDGEDEPELIVAFGRRIFAFDGDTGTSADISTGWSAPIEVPHRTWASPAIADLDGDGYLDILVGDTLISEAKPDVAVLADARGIGFTPPDPDPGEMVTISCQFSNIGIVDTDAPVTAVLKMDGVEIKRHRVNIVEAVAPSGEGGPISFSVDVEATLGVHDVELILDSNNNLTQTRTDNDYFSTSLTVLEPFVAEIQTPTEVNRALPGQSSIVDITVTSTGSRTADWTLTYDDTTLPSGWSFSPLNSTSLNLNLEKDESQIVQFEYFVPNNAEGSDSAYIPLQLTLDSDENITTTATLPLEVERTRGLSLQGASGLPSGTGFGKPGDVAHVWILIENVGNAQETTEMQWSSNSWSSQSKVVDYSGNTQWSIELEPSAMEQYLIEVNVPIGTALGESTTSVLTLCIGSGDDQICEGFTATIISSDVSTNIPHIRTIPTSGLSWEIEANYDGVDLVWDMSAASMLKEGWIWNVSGDLVINGTMLEMQGSNGVLHLELPFDAEPKRHFFNQSAVNLSHTDLSISLHILQVYRVTSEVVDPVNDSTFNVSERTKLVIQLENPGNGEDTFMFEGMTNQGNLSSIPIIEFEISNPTKTLGPGGLANVPIWVTLPDDIPAKERFEIVFKWTSMGDQTVHDYANITIQARPDHRWDVTISQGSEITALPNEEVSLDLLIQNTGNSDDLLTINPQFDLSFAGNDQSTWEIDSINSSRLNINQTEELKLNFSIPSDAWFGTIANLSLQLYSGDFSINQSITVSINVEETSGWALDLSNTSLEVPPEGGSIQVRVQQIGNSPQTPFFSKAGGGWNISHPASGSTVNPGEFTTVNISIYPPEDAVAGEIGIINFKTRNGDGSGSVTDQIPIRVGATPGLIVDSKGSWLVKQGVHSMPTAWIENIGNEVAIVNISILNVPTGWDLIGDEVMVIAPKEITGLPISISPNPTWNGNNIQLDIIITHPILGQITHEITVSESSNVITSNPVQTGRFGEKVLVTVHTDDGVEDSLVDLPQTRSNITHQGVILHLIGKSAPQHSVSCSNSFGDLSKLGIEELSMTWTSCEIVANPNYELLANAWIKTNTGEVLDYQIIRLPESANQTINLSINSWDPEPGTVIVDVLIIDSNGIELYSSQSTHIARQSGWNIRISNFEITDEKIQIGIDRSNYQIMEGSICKLDLSQVDGDWSESLIVDIYSSKYAPSKSLDRPDEIGDNSEVTATVYCNAPWDIDDNPEDNSKSVYASSLPAITYQSSDIYWTLGVAGILVIIAFLGGILNFNNRPKSTAEKEDVDMAQATNNLPKQTQTEEVEMQIDDISLEEIPEEEAISTEETDETEPPEIKQEDIEEETIDIDDGTASGRLSALRREIATDGKPSVERDDISRRMDSFFKNR